MHRHAASGEPHILTLRSLDHRFVHRPDIAADEGDVHTRYRCEVTMREDPAEVSVHEPRYPQPIRWLTYGNRPVEACLARAPSPLGGPPLPASPGTPPTSGGEM